MPGHYGAAKAMQNIGIDSKYIKKHGRSAKLTPYKAWNPSTRKLNGRKFRERPYKLTISGGGRGFGAMPYKFNSSGGLL